MANSTTLYQLGDGRIAVDVSENKTLAATDCGVVQNVISDAITVTLPSTAAGLSYTIRNAGVKATGGAAGTGSNGTVAVNVSPAAADKIQGLQVTAADNKDFINTKSTSKVGDEVKIVGDGVDGWLVHSAVGTWAREA